MQRGSTAEKCPRAVPRVRSRAPAPSREGGAQSQTRLPCAAQKGATTNERSESAKIYQQWSDAQASTYARINVAGLAFRAKDKATKSYRSNHLAGRCVVERMQ